MNRPSGPLKVNARDPGASIVLAAGLNRYLSSAGPSRPVVTVCIGTDRSTGDSLGPLVGMLLERRKPPGAPVYGTLDQPVHAVNLRDTLDDIERTFRDPFIIAVDACLGQLASVGSVQLCEGPVKPGAGVNKQLPPVGHIHLTGVVNVGGFMEYLVLQNTRLSVVMGMAEVIADALCRALAQRQRLAVRPPEPGAERKAVLKP
jgi:putative sporulation protein YyaC